MTQKERIEELENRLSLFEMEFRAIRDILGNVSTRNLDLMSDTIRRYGKTALNKELSMWLSSNRYKFEKYKKE